MQLAVDGDGPAARLGQAGAAAARAARGGDHQRLAGRLVGTLHQQPGVPVRHAHPPGGLADAVPAVDALQQFDAARPQQGLSVPLGPDVQAHGPVAAPGTVIGGHVCVLSLWRS